MKKIKYCLLFMASLMFSSCNIGTYTYIYDNAEKYVKGSCEVSSNINNLSVDWVKGNIKFFLYDGNTFKFEESSNETITDDLTMRYFLDSNNLSIKYAKSQTYVNQGIFFVKTLSVYIPKTGFSIDKLEVDMSAGNIEGEIANTRSCEIDMASGNINIKCTNFDEMKIDQASGNITFEQIGSSNKLDVESATGTAKIYFETIKEVKYDSSTSNVELYAKKNFDKVSIETTTGSIEANIFKDINFKAVGKITTGKMTSSDYTVSNNTIVYDGGIGEQKNISFESTTGTITVKKLNS